MSSLGLSIPMMEAYQSIISSLSRFCADNERNKIETLAIIICTTKYCFLPYPKMYSDVSEECARFLMATGNAMYSKSVDNRIQFYFDFIKGKQPFGEWIFDEDGFGRNIEVLRAQAAYGDIIFCPSARDDYDECYYSISTNSEFKLMRMLQENVLGTLNVLQLKCNEAQKRRKTRSILVALMWVAIFVASFFFYKAIL